MENKRTSYFLDSKWAPADVNVLESSTLELLELIRCLRWKNPKRSSPPEPPALLAPLSCWMHIVLISIIINVCLWYNIKACIWPLEWTRVAKTFHDIYAIIKLHQHEHFQNISSGEHKYKLNMLNINITVNWNKGT